MKSREYWVLCGHTGRFAMKIYGVFDQSRNKEQLSITIAKMRSTLNRGSYESDSFIAEGVGVGRLLSEAASLDTQPIWNEDRSRSIVMVGKVFDYEAKKRELLERGHEFEYPKSDAEFVLHGFEEWGNKFTRELNGTFVFAIYDADNGTFTIVNDRFGMRPLYYYNDDSIFVFASEVKGVIADKKVKKEINWDGWRDFFSYGYLLGTKTLLKNILALPNATILTLTNSKIAFHKYWSYEQIRIDYDSSEEYFVRKGVELLRQAIERQTKDLEECIVLLSGGYDSRCIASALKYYTTVDFETYTTQLSTYMTDVFLARETAKCLGVKNTYIPRPRNPYVKYLIEEILLLDGMCIGTWPLFLYILSLVDKLQKARSTLMESQETPS